MHIHVTYWTLLGSRAFTHASAPQVRAFGETQRFQKKCNDNTDFFVRTIMCQATIGRWLEVRLQAMGGVTLFCTSLAMTVFPGLLDAGLAGLALNYSVEATGTLKGFINNYTELELKMNGIERVKYYTEVTTEAPYDSLDTASQQKQKRGISGGGSSAAAAAAAAAGQQLVVVPSDWPRRGRVEFRGVSARYRKELELVLNDVSFIVEAGQKVGVCGRTGSGKSSMMLTLFRILELDAGTVPTQCMM